MKAPNMHILCKSVGELVRLSDEYDYIGRLWFADYDRLVLTVWARGEADGEGRRG